MHDVIVTEGLSKCFGDNLALDRVSLRIPAGSVTGLVGRNGSGKSTLLRTVAGLYLPSAGSCETLGAPVGALSAAQLTRIGYLDQEAKYIDWMRVREHLDYVASYYPSWDKQLEARLIRELEVHESAKVGTLSPGNRQKLGILLAVCHRPELLLLDEPASALDPIVREQMMGLLMTLLADSVRSIVVSSHILHDVERLVDRIVCLDQGHLVQHRALDELQEGYAEWLVSARQGKLPQFMEGYILSQESVGAQARLVVREPAQHLQEFAERYEVDVQARPLTLEQIFPLLLKEAA
jgi:ABC-2 type transport system ATP-binding protein